MVVDTKFLRKHNACEEGIRWFYRKFGRRTTLREFVFEAMKPVKRKRCRDRDTNPQFYYQIETHADYLSWLVRAINKELGHFCTEWIKAERYVSNLIWNCRGCALHKACLYIKKLNRSSDVIDLRNGSRPIRDSIIKSCTDANDCSTEILYVLIKDAVDKTIKRSKKKSKIRSCSTGLWHITLNGG